MFAFLNLIDILTIKILLLEGFLLYIYTVGVNSTAKRALFTSVFSAFLWESASFLPPTSMLVCA